MHEIELAKFNYELITYVMQTLTASKPFAHDGFVEFAFRVLHEQRQLTEIARVNFEEISSNAGNHRLAGYIADSNSSYITLVSSYFCGQLSLIELDKDNIELAARNLLQNLNSTTVQKLSLDLNGHEISVLNFFLEQVLIKTLNIRLVILTNATVQQNFLKMNWEKVQVEIEIIDCRLFYCMSQSGVYRFGINIGKDFLGENGLNFSQLESSKTLVAAIPATALSRMKMQLTCLTPKVTREASKLAPKSTAVDHCSRTSQSQSEFEGTEFFSLKASASKIHIERNFSGYDTIVALENFRLIDGFEFVEEIHRLGKLHKTVITGFYYPIFIQRADLYVDKSNKKKPTNSTTTKFEEAEKTSEINKIHYEIARLAESSWYQNGRGRWRYQSTGSAPAKNGLFLQLTKSKIQNSKNVIKAAEIAKLTLSWRGQPNLIGTVSSGGQKLVELKLDNQIPKNPDRLWFIQIIAIKLILNEISAQCRRLKLNSNHKPFAYYVLAAIGSQSDLDVNFEKIWARQKVDDELKTLISKLINATTWFVSENAGFLKPNSWFDCSSNWRNFRDIAIQVL